MPTKSRKPRKEPHATIAEQLQKLRTENDLTVDDFAKKCGVPPTTARGWLNGKVLPRMETATNIVTAFGVSLDWLFFGEAKPKYPWEPKGWTPESARLWAREYFQSVGSQLLEEEARRDTLERIYRLADRAGDAGQVDYDTEADIREKVGELAVALLVEVRGSVRDVIDHELRTRIAKYVILDTIRCGPES